MTVPTFISDRIESGRYFFLDLNPPRRMSLAVVCGGREVCGPNYQVNRRSFRYWALEYVEAGEGELVLEGQRLWLQPGVVFTYGPGVSHDFRSTGPHRLTKHFVDFTGRSAKTLLRHSGLDDARSRLLTQTHWVQSLFDQLLETGQGRSAFAQKQCPLLLRLLLNRIEEDAAPQSAVESAAFATFCRCRQYLTDHFVNLATIAEVANECRVAPAYLSRLFNRYAGEGAHAFLVRLKIHRAAELLTGQGTSVRDAGLAVGYDDAYHFSRVFKRVYGVAPRRFVQRVQRQRNRPGAAE